MHMYMIPTLRKKNGCDSMHGCLIFIDIYDKCLSLRWFVQIPSMCASLFDKNC